MSDCSGVDRLPNETTNDIFDLNTREWTNYMINGEASVKCDTCVKRDTTNNPYFYNRQAYLDSKGKSIRMHNSITSYDKKSITNLYDLQSKTNCNGHMKFTTATLKYSNPQYSTNNAVSSSSRIARLKYQTINKNYNSLNNNLMPAAYKINLKYRGNSEAPNILKNAKAGGTCNNRKGNRRCMKFL